MWVLLVIGFLIPFVYFAYMLSKLDRFLINNSVTNLDEKIFPVAIVLGRSDHAKQVIKLLEKNGVDIFQIDEPYLFRQELNLRYLFALSDNDADNIVLCKLGMKMYNIEDMISICNDRRNEGMFISERISYLSGEGVTAMMLFQAVLEEVEIKS